MLTIADALRSLVFEGNFEETKHPRGHEGNRGQFTHKGQGQEGPAPEQPAGQAKPSGDKAAPKAAAGAAPADAPAAQPAAPDAAKPVLRQEPNQPFNAEYWLSMPPFPDRNKAWKALPDRERDRLADPVNTVPARMTEHLDDLPEQPNTGNLKADVATRMSQFQDRIAGPSLEKMTAVMDTYQQVLGEAGIDPEKSREVVMMATDLLAAQEMESMTRQLGDHGIHHIAGNIDVADRILQALPNGASPQDRVLSHTACLFHDAGYMATPSRNCLDEGHQRWGTQFYQAHVADKVTALLGRQEAGAIEHLILTHDATNIDWTNDAVGTAVRIADNVALFHPDKLPGVFRYAPENIGVLTQLAAKQIDVPTAHAQMRANVEKANVPERVKDLLMSAVKEVNQGSGGFTLGMLGGKVGAIGFEGESLRIDLEADPQATELHKIGDFGQAQFAKFAKTYGIDPEVFKKTLEFELRDKAGNTLLKTRMTRKAIEALIRMLKQGGGYWRPDAGGRMVYETAAGADVLIGGDWDEDKHPRGEAGRFARKGTEGGKSEDELEAQALFDAHVKSTRGKPVYGLADFLDVIKRQTPAETKPAPSVPAAVPSPVATPPIPASQLPSAPPLPAGVSQAGDPRLNTVKPETGKVAWTTNGESGRLQAVQLSGKDGDFDGREIWKWTWLDGPDAGTTDSGYGRTFYEPAVEPAPTGNIDDYLDATKYSTRQAYVDAETERLRGILPDDDESTLRAQAEMWATERWKPAPEPGKFSVDDPVMVGDKQYSFRGTVDHMGQKLAVVAGPGVGQMSVPIENVRHVGEKEPVTKEPWQMTKDEHRDNHPGLKAATKKRDAAQAAIGAGRWGETRRFAGRSSGLRLDRLESAKERWRREFDLADTAHRKSVEDAVKIGKPVPKEVLKEYPDLAAQSENRKDEGKPDTGGPQTETKAFKAWFGDSKVVGGDGKPLRVYHGTSKTFTEFGGDGARDALAAIGWHFFSDNPEFAGKFVGGDEPLDFEPAKEKEKPVKAPDTTVNASVAKEDGSGEERQQMPAWSTKTPGLVIRRLTDDGDHYMVLHAESGLAVGGSTFKQCQKLAKELGALKVDWTKGLDVVTKLPAETRSAIHDATSKAADAGERERRKASFAKMPQIDPMTLQWKSSATSVGSQVLPVFLRMEKPIDLRSLGIRPQNPDKLIAALKEHGIEMTIRDMPFSGRRPYQMLNDASVAEKILAQARAKGYDGIIFKDYYDAKLKGDSYIVFDGAQVKSATGNKGTFDSSSKNIGEGEWKVGPCGRPVFEARQPLRGDREDPEWEAHQAKQAQAKPAAPADAAPQAGDPEWDEGKHPRGEGGKFAKVAVHGVQSEVKPDGDGWQFRPEGRANWRKASPQTAQKIQQKVSQGKEGTGEQPAGAAPEGAPAPGKKPAGGKQDWQLTRREIEKRMNSSPEWQNASVEDRMKLVYNAAGEHHQQVKDAVKAGQTVPPEVLKDYPDLQKLAASGGKTEPVKPMGGTDAAQSFAPNPTGQPAPQKPANPKTEPHGIAKAAIQHEDKRREAAKRAVDKARAADKAGKRYTAKTGGGDVHLPDAQPVKLRGLEDVEFVAHKTLGMGTNVSPAQMERAYTVSDAKSGMAIAFGKSAQDAVQNAERTIQRRGVQAVRQKLASVHGAPAGEAPGAAPQTKPPAGAAPAQQQVPQQTPAAQPTAAPKSQWFASMGDNAKEDIFKHMREIGEKVNQARERASKLQPAQGTIGVGSADFDENLRAEALSSFLRVLQRGGTPDEAAAQAKKDARAQIKSWNERGSKGRVKMGGAHELDRWEGSADHYIDDALREMHTVERRHRASGKAA